MNAVVLTPEGSRLPITEQKIRLLNYLKQNDGNYVSGQELADKLGYSRPVIWQDVQYFKKLNYRIVARKNLGYRFSAGAEILHPLEYLPHLHTERTARTCAYYRVTESTQFAAKSLIDAGVPSGTVVIAEYQSKGVGRFGRKWFSLFGKDILCSVILFPALSASDAQVLPMAIAVSVADAIAEETGLSVNLMWPNDIMYAQKKLGGVIVDASLRGNEVASVVIGMALNVNASAADYPRGLRETLTTLRDLTGAELSRNRLFARMMEHWEAELTRLEAGERSSIIKRWRDAALFLGDKVTVVLMDGGILEGTATDVDASGRLEMETADGTRTLSAADVLNIRSSPRH